MSDRVPFNASEVMHTAGCPICSEYWVVGEKIIRNVEIPGHDEQGHPIIRRCKEVHEICYQALLEAEKP